MNVMKNLCVILTEEGRKKIKIERIRKFGSQMNVQYDTEIPQVNISRWERGSGDPRFYLFRSYLQKLGIYKGFLKNKTYVKGTKYRGFKIKKIRPTKLTLEKSYILGVVGPGDGYINGNYQVGLNSIDNEFVDYFQYCLEKTFGLKCKRYLKIPYKENWKKQYVVRLCSKSVVESLKNNKVSFKEKIWEIPEIIKKSGDSYKSMYLKGIFDSQGCVVDKGRFMYVKIENKEGIKEIKSFLKDIGIDSHIHSDGFKLQISGKKNLELYDSKIGFIVKRKEERLKNLLEKYTLNIPTRQDVLRVLPKMIELRKEGLTYNKISSIVGIGRGSVGRNLQKMGY